MSEISSSRAQSPTNGPRSDSDQSYKKAKTINKIKRDQSEFTEATLEGAEFEAKKYFMVKDYVHRGEHKKLKHHSLKTGHSW